jgi:hypothetical protein
MNQNLYDAATNNFNLPHDIVTLPSGGVFYKNKKKSIKVGYLTAQDENILMGALQGKREEIVLSLLRNKIYEHDLKPEDLLDCDIEAVLIFLRNTSFGPEYKVSVLDPKTDKRFETSILLDELNIIPPKNQPDENGLFITTLPKSGNVVKLKPLSFSDTLELERRADNYPTGRTIPIVTWRLEKLIQEVDGNNDRSNISMFVTSIPIMDSKFIKTFIKENLPSLDLTKKIVAPSGEEVSVDINFGVEFFRPFF